jgi:hypothetical protein
MAKIASEAIPQLKSQIDAATADPQGIPGVVFAAVNKNGWSPFLFSPFVCIFGAVATVWDGRLLVGCDVIWCINVFPA